MKEESRLKRKGFKRVVGIDEVGRGPLAGPVVACAVLVNKKPRISGINDSKQLSPKKREELYRALTKHPDIKWGIGKVSEKVIDRINILEATKLAMIKATKKLNPDFLIIDGNMTLDLNISQKAIIKADQKVFSCMASSIIAKVTRDRIMEKQKKKFPKFSFDKHKGYPTKLHLKELKKNRASKIHRKSFKPVYLNI